MDRRDFFQNSALFGFGIAIDARRFFTGEEPQETALPPKAEASAPAAPAIRGGTEDPHMRRVPLTPELLVAGGGMSGVCAALAAARNGTETVLVQDRSRLGGNASSEIRMHIVGADVHGSRSGWREGGLIEEIRLEDAVHNPHRAHELFDLLLYDLCKREEKLTLLLDTSVYRAGVEKQLIREVLARCDKSETIYEIRPRLCVDATGDGRLALEAGAEFREGREPRSKYGESLALEKGDDKSQGCSILFTARKHDREIPFVAPPWARTLTEKDLLFRKPGKGSYEYGYWWIELGGTLDVIHDNEKLRFELLRVVLGVWDWIKNSGNRPDSKNWALESVGMIPGKRESRRLTGAHIQTQQDLNGLWKKRDDGVSIGGWGFDEHPPGGFDAWNQPPYYSKPVPEPYNIAFEALYSRNIHNLMMAGRNISNSHVAFTSTRVMATCACTGQAVGTAAALCREHGLLPKALRKARMGELQQRLLRDDQSIRKVANQDARDLARSARVRASAFLKGADPVHVIDGHVRDTPGEWKHRWGAQAKNDGSANAWIELSWKAAQRIAFVQICFDSGFHRELTLSASDGVTRRMIRGPQPETVRDYKVTAKTKDGEVLLAEVKGNYQRLRRHAFDEVLAESIRLHVTATNGSKEVRVYELRCYRERPNA